MLDGPISSNWGRWGPDDQCGALNLLTPDVVRRGLAAGRGGRVVSLALPVAERALPRVPFRAPALHFTTLDGGDYLAGARTGAGGFQFADDFIAMPAHTGTHVDALSHVARDGVMFNGTSASTIRSTTGAQKLGIEHFRGLVARALMFDICALRDGAPLEPGEEVRVNDLEMVLDRSGLQVRPGDAVLIRTGWIERLDPADPTATECEAGLGMDAARWLADRDVSLIGADNFAVEVVPSASGEVMPVHLLCLQEFGIHLMELVDLRPLAHAGVGECLLIVAPLPIVGGLGSPVNPLAVF
jgi:kynurenine formamidase